MAKNPWTAEHWNLTQQMAVYQADPAEAERLARAAGTTIGGKRPPKPWDPVKQQWFRPGVYLMRAGRGGTTVVQTPPSVLTLTGSLNYRQGFDVAVAITLEVHLNNITAALGFDTAAAVELGIDLPATTHGLGFDIESEFDFEVHIQNVAHDLGFDAASVFSNIQNIVASAALGFDMTAAITTTAVDIELEASPALGFDMAAALVNESLMSAAPSLGFDMAATFTNAIGFTATAALGFDIEVDLTVAAPAEPAIIIFQEARIDSSGDDDVTFTDVAIGDEHEQRWVCIGITRRFGGNFTGVTCDGVAMTRIDTNGAAAGDWTQLYLLKKPAGGTTADIIVSLASGAPNGVGISSYYVENLYDPDDDGSDPLGTVLDSFVDNNTPLTYDANVVEDGGVIGVGMNTGAVTFTWTGPTEDADQNNGALSHTSASTPTPISADGTMTVALAGGIAHRYSLVSFLPNVPQPNEFPAEFVGAASLDVGLVALSPHYFAALFEGAASLSVGLNAIAPSYFATPFIGSAALTVGLNAIAPSYFAVGVAGAADVDVAFEITAPAVALTKTFLHSAVQTTDANTYTFSTVGIGTADATRRIVVAVHGEDTTNHSITSVTVGGVAAYPLLGITNLTSTRHFSMWMADVPTGTTANIVVVFSATTNDCQIGVWSITSTGAPAEPYAIVDSKHTNANTISQVLQTVDDGCIIAGATNTGSFAATWSGTGIGEDYDDASSTHGGSGASGVTTGANVTLGYSHAGGGSGSGSGGGISFGFGGNLWMKNVFEGGQSPSTATHTYSSIRLGGARADRHVVVSVIGIGSNRTISSVTIGGVTATPIATHGSGSLLGGGLYYAKLTSGTTANVVINFSSSIASSCCTAWVVFGADDIEVVDSFVGNNASPLTDTLTADANGIVLTASYQGFVSYTSPTTPYFQDHIIATSPAVSRGAGSQRTFGSSVTVTADNGAAGSGDWMHACTLRPAP